MEVANLIVTESFLCHCRQLSNITLKAKVYCCFEAILMVDGVTLNFEIPHNCCSALIGSQFWWWRILKKKFRGQCLILFSNFSLDQVN
jgi:hypothetical protein